MRVCDLRGVLCHLRGSIADWLTSTPEVPAFEDAPVAMASALGGQLARDGSPYGCVLDGDNLIDRAASDDLRASAAVSAD